MQGGGQQISTKPAARVRFLASLGLSQSDSRADWVDRNAHVRQLAVTSIATLFIQIFSTIVIIVSAIMVERADLLRSSAIASGVVLTAGLLLSGLLLIPPMRGWPAYRHARISVVVGATQAAGLMTLLWIAVQLPSGPYQLASFAAVLGALGTTAAALHPIRAATLALVSVTTVSVFAHVGVTALSLIGLSCLACLIVTTRRLALVEIDRALQKARIDDDGRLAAQLIREFESHGTGWFWQTDRHGNITYLTSKVAEALAVGNTDPIGQPLTAIFRMDRISPGTERTLSFHLSSRTSFSDYAVHAAADRTSDRWWSISGRPVTDSLGGFQGFIGSGSDLTEKRLADAEITRLALFDGLTGLANRQRMRLSLDQTLNQPGGIRRPTALFLLDLDRFKVVNDTLGHQTGDALLKQVGQRLMRSVGDSVLVGRLGGDEFQVVLPGESDTNKLSDLARDIIGALSQPYTIDGTSISIGCSIGVAIAPNDGDNSETLVRNADLALYAAKADGRGVHRFYRAELLQGAQNRKQLEDDLRQALAGNQFHLVYQPVVSTQTTRIVGYEALLRWEHPSRGSVSPAEFVPIAEDCGLIEPIGEWVLRTACHDAAEWPRDIRVAVNVSPIQFANPALPTLVTNALANSGIAPGRLELEITEGVFLDESASTDAMFKSLKTIGVRLALDDFGTGYSSLGYLKTAPFDKIKIDQSFVRGAAAPASRNAAIIRAIVTLAETLGMETTAEGVEAQDEIDLIRELGCSHIQGFVYGRPAHQLDVLVQLTEGQGLATPSGFRVSRSQRTTVMRTAILEIEGERGEVRIRNLSSTGAMIEGIDFGPDPGDVSLLIELLEGQMFPGKLRWAKGGRAGIEFNEHFNLDRLGAGLDTRHMRKAG